MTTTIPTSSPWGEVDHHTVIAEGIVFVGTSSHGGIKLSPQRMADFPAELLGDDDGFLNQRQRGWFEEDCDATLVVLAFPKEFEIRQVRSALESAKCWQPAVAKAFLASVPILGVNS
jgi:hypothetical protein